MHQNAEGLEKVAGVAKDLSAELQKLGGEAATRWESVMKAGAQGAIVNPIP